MFYGTDPEHHSYRGRAHLAEIIALLGPPPPELLARGQLKTKFFSEDGMCSVSPPHSSQPLFNLSNFLTDGFVIICR
jgi:serine/threonine-protein kinase SRPK3